MCFNAKSLKYGLRSWSLRPRLRAKSCLNGFIDIKITRMKHYFNKIIDKNKSLSIKTCPHGLKSWSFSNFFLFLVTLLMCLKVKSRVESYLNGFIDMKTMRMKHYFNHNTNKNLCTKTCSHGLKSWSFSNFFLVFGHFLNVFEGWIESRKLS